MPDRLTDPLRDLVPLAHHRPLPGHWHTPAERCGRAASWCQADPADHTELHRSAGLVTAHARSLAGTAARSHPLLVLIGGAQAVDLLPAVWAAWPPNAHPSIAGARVPYMSDPVAPCSPYHPERPVTVADDAQTAVVEQLTAGAVLVVASVIVDHAGMVAHLN